MRYVVPIDRRLQMPLTLLDNSDGERSLRQHLGMSLSISRRTAVRNTFGFTLAAVAGFPQRFIATAQAGDKTGNGEAAPARFPWR